MLNKCKEMDATVFALNGMLDHVHLACSLPTKVSVADFMGDLKGASAHFINHTFPDTPLFWQPGYGVLTFSKRDLLRVTAYIRNQKARHADGTVSPSLELHETD